MFGRQTRADGMSARRPPMLGFSVVSTPGDASMAKKSPNPVAKLARNRVRMRRMMLGMSQTKLGDALHLTFRQEQKYEKGAN